MTLLVDTSVWSLAFRRDAPVAGPEVAALRAAIAGGDTIVTTGLVLQELLQGFAGPRDPSLERVIKSAHDRDQDQRHHRSGGRRR